MGIAMDPAWFPRRWNRPCGKAWRGMARQQRITKSLDCRKSPSLQQPTQLCNRLFSTFTAIGTRLPMPPNTRTGFTITAVILALYLIHTLSGKHEMRRPAWELEKKDGVQD
jgi:hypothetical protein